MAAIYNVKKLGIFSTFPEHFNESVMFNGGVEAQVLKEEFKQHFRNISRIMDCVGCDKCKLWGKLQTQGLGTALKILFSGKFDKKYEPTLWTTSRRKFYLERTEIVSLFNAFGRYVSCEYSTIKFQAITSSILVTGCQRAYLSWIDSEE